MTFTSEAPVTVVAHCALCEASYSPLTRHECTALQMMRNAERNRRELQRRELIAAADAQVTRSVPLSDWSSPAQQAYERLRTKALEEVQESRKRRHCERCGKLPVPPSEHMVGDPTTVPMTHGSAHNCERDLGPVYNRLRDDAAAQAAVPFQIQALKQRIRELEESQS